MTIDPAIRLRLVNALTDYDRRQSKGKHHNPYALAHYFGALQRAEEDFPEGSDLRRVLLSAFNGRVLDVALRAAGLPLATRDEQLGR